MCCGLAVVAGLAHGLPVGPAPEQALSFRDGSLVATSQCLVKAVRLDVVDHSRGDYLLPASVTLRALTQWVLTQECVTRLLPLVAIATGA